jgi:hypothetical protein
MTLISPFSRVLLLLLTGVSCVFANDIKPALTSTEVKDHKILVQATNVKDPAKLSVSIAGEEVKLIPNSISPIANGLSFAVEVPRDIKQVQAKVTFRYDNQQFGEKAIDVPTPDLRPEILRLNPVGGVPGSTNTIVGKNLGNDPDKVFVWIRKPDNKGEVKVQALSISPSKQDEQELKFTIPPAEQELIGDNWLYNDLTLYVSVDNHQSNVLLLTVVKGTWRRIVTGVTLLLIIFCLTILFIVGYCRGFLKTLFVEKKTKTFSLSKTQAFAWTVVLLGSYFYFAIGRGLIFGRGVIPDFNMSLLGLMGISYGGLLSARGLGSRSSKNDLMVTDASIGDLISEGNEISIPRLQLVGFNVTAIFVYVYNLSGADILSQGLPSIPAGLLELLLLSQGGYLGGKLLGNPTVVNNIVPRRIQKGNANIKVTLIGNGFIANTKLLFQDNPVLIDTDFLNSNSLSFSIPKSDIPGWKQFILVPPTGSSLVLDNIFEVVEPKIETVERAPGNNRKVTVTLKGFDLQSGILATIAGNLPKNLSICEELNQVSIELESDIAPGSGVEIKSADGQLTATATVS